MKKLVLLFLLLPFLMNAQSISGISPNTAHQGQYITVSISGQNTVFQQGTNIIKLVKGGTTLTPSATNFINDSLIDATFPVQISAPTGLYDVVVDHYMMSSTLTLTGGFSVTASPGTPSITTVTPATGAQGDTVITTINGAYTNFSGVTSGNVWLSNGTANVYPVNITPVSNTVLQAKFIFTYGNPTGYYNMHVVNSVDGSLQKSGAFQLTTGSMPPSVKNITPDYSVQGQTLTVSISGQNTVFQQGTNIIKLYKGGTTIYPATANFINDTLIDATFIFTTSHPVGAYDLIIDHYMMTSTLTRSACFTLYSNTAPAITAVSPASSVQGSSSTLTITGLNTSFGSGTDSIWLKDMYNDIIHPASINLVNATSIQAVFNFTTSNLPGIYSVYESNATNGTTSLDNSFTLDSIVGGPSIINVNPDNGGYQQNVTVDITGHGTHFLTGSNTVSLVHSFFPSIYASSVNVMNDTLMQAMFYVYAPSMGFDYYDVLVQGSDNMVLKNGFLVWMPEGLQNLEADGKISIYPDPSDGFFNVKISKTYEGGELSVTDITGKVVYSVKGLSRNTSFDLTAFPAGMYFIKLVNGDKILAGKIIRN